MRLTPLQRSAAAVALSLVSVAAQAAMKIDISATSGVSTDVTLAAGTYQLSWIGTAEGGAYDGWQFNAAPDGNWREAFTVTGLAGSTPYTIDIYAASGSYYAAYASAADALAAAQGSSHAVLSNGAVLQAPLAGPLTFTLPTATALSFTVPDLLLADNHGGVSLSISAVPEPSGWALMLAGVGGIGLLLRRGSRQG